MWRGGGTGEHDDQQGAHNTQWRDKTHAHTHTDRHSGKRVLEI